MKKIKWKVRLADAVDMEVEAEKLLTREGASWVRFYNNGKEVAIFARERVVAVIRVE